MIQQQHRLIIQNLHAFHPLRIKNFERTDYKSHEIYESKELCSYVTPQMTKRFQELHYNFHVSSTPCRLCNQPPTHGSLDYHLAVECPHLHSTRNDFWSNACIELASIARKYNHLHNQKFAQTVIEFLSNLNHPHPLNNTKLWKIICGMNLCEIDGSFKYTYTPPNMHFKNNTFLKHLYSKVHLWLHLVHRIQNNQTTINYLNRTYQPARNVDLLYHICSHRYNHWFKHYQKIKPNDIVISTDSSHKNGLTGIGIYIKFKNKTFHISEPIGSTSNHEGELYAIRKAYEYLPHHVPQFKSHQIFHITDSDNNFKPLVTHNKKTKLKFEKLLKETQKILQDLKVILWRVHSHEKPYTPCFNHFADKLADKGRTDPSNHPGLINPISFKHYAQHYTSAIADSRVQKIVQNHRVCTIMAGAYFAPDWIPSYTRRNNWKKSFFQFRWGACPHHFASFMSCHQCHRILIFHTFQSLVAILRTVIV